mmetsp:Transcript_14351/g.27689  ORF Transcript_14351/g.27689 Transcript_14351/m.27689 type:complete len:342 (+) Transcript_14351:77-1102(+)
MKKFPFHVLLVLLILLHHHRRRLQRCNARRRGGEAGLKIIESRHLSNSNEKTSRGICIFTGDHMGDIHGGLLALELKEIAGELQLQGVGGKFMRECGVAMMQGQVSTDVVSSIGLVEALPHLLRGMKAMKQARRYIKQEMPSVIVMIDYPGFNLPLLKWIRRKRLQGRFSGSKVVYYIPPNEWLFLEGSASSVCSLSNLVLSVYPDEFEHYRKSAAKGMKDGVVADENGQTKVQYVGHPLVDYVDRSKMSKSQAREIIRREQSTSSSSPQSRKSPAVIINEDSLVIALLPASRKQELSLVLPIMLEACSILADTLQQQQQQQRKARPLPSHDDELHRLCSR